MEFLNSGTVLRQKEEVVMLRKHYLNITIVVLALVIYLGVRETIPSTTDSSWCVHEYVADESVDRAVMYIAPEGHTLSGGTELPTGSLLINGEFKPFLHGSYELPNGARVGIYEDLRCLINETGYQMSEWYHDIVPSEDGNGYQAVLEVGLEVQWFNLDSNGKRIE